MNRAVFALLVFLNGLLIGLVSGLVLAPVRADRDEPPVVLAPPPAASEPAPHYVFEEDPDGRMSFFDQTTGRHVSFNRIDDLWFVMTYDPVQGTVSYAQTRLIEDPMFLEAAKRLKDNMPERMGRQILLQPGSE
jgi:hypothetical protein